MTVTDRETVKVDGQDALRVLHAAPYRMREDGARRCVYLDLEEERPVVGGLLVLDFESRTAKFQPDLGSNFWVSIDDLLPAWVLHHPERVAIMGFLKDGKTGKAFFQKRTRAIREGVQVLLSRHLIEAFTRNGETHYRPTPLYEFVKVIL